MLNWPEKCFLVVGTVANQVLTFTITDTKLHVQVITLSTLDNLLFLSFEDIDVRRSYKQYFLPIIEIKDYNVMIDGQIILII